MPLYYLHVYNRIGCSRDDEGQELPDLEAARGVAIEGIRSILSEEVVHGVIDFAGRIEIADAAGEVLACVPYRDAVEVRQEEGAG